MKSDWLNFIAGSLKEISENSGSTFKNMKPADLPKTAGVYLITVGNEPYYVGRTKNLQKRIYTDHLMGNVVNAPLKRYLIDSGECANLQAAKQFLRQHAVVSWIEVEDMRTRGALEGYFTGVLFPKYGITEEH